MSITVNVLQESTNDISESLVNALKDLGNNYQVRKIEAALGHSKLQTLKDYSNLNDIFVIVINTDYLEAKIRNALKSFYQNASKNALCPFIVVIAGDGEMPCELKRFKPLRFTDTHFARKLVKRKYSFTRLVLPNRSSRVSRRELFETSPHFIASIKRGVCQEGPALK